MLDNGITLNNYIDVANCDHEAETVKEIQEQQTLHNYN